MCQIPFNMTCLSGIVRQSDAEPVRQSFNEDGSCSAMNGPLETMDDRFSLWSGRDYFRRFLVRYTSVLSTQSSVLSFETDYLRLNICSNHLNDSSSVIFSLLATAGENTANVPVALAQHTSSSLKRLPSIKTSRLPVFSSTVP